MPKNSEADRIFPLPPKRAAIHQLDTVRVLAMLAIFMHHLWKTVIVSPQGMLQKALDPVFTSASDGVILFNLISGFLLAMPHLGPESRPFAGYRLFFSKALPSRRTSLLHCAGYLHGSEHSSLRGSFFSCSGDALGAPPVRQLV